MMNVFYNLLIYPIVIVYEIIYNIFNNAFHTNLYIDNAEFFSIVIVSLFVNVITFPLYKRADEIQKEVRIKKDGMQKWISHINKNFKGDEKYFILSTYYKENDYKPIDELKESLSLLLQIPFFAAAYIFFTSNLDMSKIYIFDLINLGKPDSLLNIGSISINILPVFMTLINIISASIYTKGYKLKEKLSSFALPILFLIILYNSPSALVIYWTLNNIFSLIKIIYLKNKNKDLKNIKAKNINAERINKDNLENDDKIKIDNTIIYLLISISLFLGIIIPSLTIKASPDEFDSVYYSAFSFLGSTFIVFLGFSIWLYVFYIFSKNKNIFIKILFSLSVYGVINHIFYLNNLRNVSTLLKLSSNMNFSISEIISDIVAFFIIIALALDIVIKKKKSFIRSISKVFLLTCVLWSVINIFDIYKGLNATNKNTAVAFETEEQMRNARRDFFYGKKAYVKNKTSEGKSNVEADGSKPIVNISTRGKNVIMICLDRYVGKYLSYVMEVLPELKEKFKGFTVYKNVISFGANTITAAPAMYGGYEYTPDIINKKNEELVNSHNEAISIIPKILSDNGYNITVAELPYENYYEVKKESIWDKIDNLKSVYLEESIKSKVLDENVYKTYDLMKRNFIYYSIVRIVPVILKKQIYDDGKYLNKKNDLQYGTLFLENYAVLESLSKLTNIVDDNTNNAIIMHNLLSHEPTDLYYPDFYPEPDIKNSINKDKNSYLKNLVNKDGNRFEGSEEYLDVDIASMLNIGKFLDYLRENNAYDNTRIVIVSDHGGVDTGYEFDKSNQVLEPNKNKPGEYAYCYPQSFNPILMYKDFNADTYEESDEFMTNADTSYLLLNGIIDDMKNPYTGNIISMDYKNDNEDFYIISGVKPQVGYYIGENKFVSENGYWVRYNKLDNRIYNGRNWKIIYEDEVEEIK